MSIAGIATAADTVLSGVGGLLGGKSAAERKGDPAWRSKFAQAQGMTVAQLVSAGGIPSSVKAGGRGFGGQLRRAEGRAGSGAVGASLPNVDPGGTKPYLASGGPSMRSIGVTPAIPPSGLPAPLASPGIMEMGRAAAAAAAGLPGFGVSALPAVRSAIRALTGARRGGGEVFATRGTDFLSTGGYPVGPSLEDLAEQTYTPDLWARRLARGVVVPNAPLKRFYSVPLVDQEGDIEGRLRATGCAIPASAVILYGGGDSSIETAHLIAPLMKSYKLKGTAEVVDEEGGGADPVLGYVYVPKYKRRRGGIHVSAKDLAAAKKVGRSMESIIKTHGKLKVIKPSRRR